MKLELRIPISPNGFFFRRIEFLHKSLRRRGGATGEAHLVISVGEDIEPFDLYQSQPWSRDGVTWRWVDREAFRRDSYFATGLDRFKVKTDVDIVMFADADLIFVAGVDDLLESLIQTPAVAGLMAHVHPPPMPNTAWDNLFAEAEIRPPRDLYQYSGWRQMDPDPGRRFGPAYYNFGAVFMPAPWVATVGYFYERFIANAERAGADQWKAQVALTLAIYKLGRPRRVLEPRYNFPNIPSFDDDYPADLKDVRILHYLRGEIISKERDFASAEALQALIARKDLCGSNEVLRATLERLNSASSAKKCSAADNA